MLVFKRIEHLSLYLIRLLKNAVETLQKFDVPCWFYILQFDRMYGVLAALQPCNVTTYKYNKLIISFGG